MRRGPGRWQRSQSTCTLLLHGARWAPTVLEDGLPRAQQGGSHAPGSLLGSRGGPAGTAGAQSRNGWASRSREAAAQPSGHLLHSPGPRPCSRYLWGPGRSQQLWERPFRRGPWPAAKRSETSETGAGQTLEETTCPTHTPTAAQSDTPPRHRPPDGAVFPLWNFKGKQPPLRVPSIRSYSKETVTPSPKKHRMAKRQPTDQGPGTDWSRLVCPHLWVPRGPRGVCI